MPIDQAARHCGVSVGMLSKLEHARRVLDGLGLMMLVVPKTHAPWPEQAAAPAAEIGEDAAREQYA